jgi:nucleoside-diphosphate-sugar epimerase
VLTFVIYVEFQKKLPKVWHGKVKVIVAGASGFIGSNLCNTLAKNGHEVLALYRTNSKRTSFPLQLNSVLIDSAIDIDSLTRACSSFDADFVVNAAGDWRVSQAEENVDKIVQANVEFPLVLANLALEKGCNFVTLSSFWQLEDSDLHKVSNCYTESKINFENLIDNLVSEQGLKATSIYLYDNYGLNDSRDKIVDQLISRGSHSKPIKLSDPSRYLNLLHISDVINGIITYTLTDLKTRKLEISCNEVVSLGYLVSIVEECLEASLSIEWESISQDWEPFRKHNSTLKRPEGWEPKVDLRSGIEGLVKRKK